MSGEITLTPHESGWVKVVAQIDGRAVFSAFAENNILQVLLFSVLFGSALNLVGEAASGITRLINELSHVIFRIMGMIVRLAPIGVFGAIAFTTSKYGLDSLQHLAELEYGRGRYAEALEYYRLAQTTAPIGGVRSRSNHGGSLQHAVKF